jgi:integrase
MRALDENSRSDAERSRWIKMELALVLAEATGRRLGAIRQLQWKDIDLESQTIRWRAESDKQGQEWIVPIPDALADELRARFGGSSEPLAVGCSRLGGSLISRWTATQGPGFVHDQQF